MKKWLNKIDEFLHRGSVRTSHGWMRLGRLRKVVTVADGAEATVTATEYWLQDELVHRSIHAALKGRDLSNYQGVL